MKKPLILLSTIFLIFCNHMYCQQEINGEVLDSQTGLPISDVSIHIKGEDKGTISNINGEFVIENDDNSLTLTFTHVAYKEQDILLSNSNGSDLKIVLQPKITALDEVVITSYNVNDIITQTYKKGVKQSKHKRLSSLFYRQTTITNNSPSEFIEAFYKGKISSTNIEQMELFQGRFAQIPADNNNSTPSIVNFYYFSTIPAVQQKINDVVFPINEKFDQYYEYTISKIIESVDQGDIAVVNFIPKHYDTPIFEGQVYIDLKNFKVFRMKGDIKNELGLSFKNKSFKAINPIYHFDISFHNIEKNYALFNSIKVSLNFSLVTKKNTQNVTVNSTMLAYDCSDMSTEKKNKKVKGNRNLINDIKKENYDAKFWKDNPIIKRSQNEDSIINVFERQNLFQSTQN